MSVMHIALPLIGHSEEENAIRLAATLGAELDASVHGSFLIPAFPLQQMQARFKSMERYDYYGYPDIINNFREAFARHEVESVERVKHFFEEHVKHLPKSLQQPALSWREDHVHVATQEDYLLRLSILSDFMVVSGILREEADYENTLSHFLLHASRPVIVVPPKVATLSLKDSTILIGWEATPASIRAITMAMPLLRCAKNVKIMSLNENNKSVSLEEIVAFLSSHQVNATALPSPKNTHSPEENFVKAAHQHQVNMIVMGGFAHSRLLDLVLGNTAEFVLEQAAWPVCLVH